MAIFLLFPALSRAGEANLTSSATSAAETSARTLRLPELNSNSSRTAKYFEHTSPQKFVQGRTPGQDFSASLGKLEGEMEYQIKFPAGRSRLIFPVDNNTFGFNFRGRIPEVGRTGKNRLTWQVSWREVLGGPAGQAEDYDWLDSDPAPDIYGRMDCELETGRILETSLSFDVQSQENLWLGITGGLRREYYRLKNDNVYQEDDSGNVITTDKVAIIYERKMLFPYFGFGINGRLPPSIDFAGRFLFSPEVRVEDEDDHTLRNKISRGETYGDGVILRGRLTYHLSPRAGLLLSIEKLRTEAEGHQDQYWYGDDPGIGGDQEGDRISNIPLETKMEHSSISIALRYYWE